MQPQIIPVIYRSDDDPNFLEMIKDEKYSDSLFLFKDSHDAHTTTIPSTNRGDLRPYNRYGEHRDYPRSAGVVIGPTDNQVYSDNLSMVYKSIDEIRELIEEYHYKRIFFLALRGVFRPLFANLLISREDIGKITNKIYELGIYTPYQDLSRY